MERLESLERRLRDPADSSWSHPASMVARPSFLGGDARSPLAGNLVRARFPKLYLLDSKAFSKTVVDSLDFEFEAPQEISNLLLPGDVEAICNEYFYTAHCWMPILSRKRLYREIGELDRSWNASLTLLLLCMKLVSEPTQDGNNPGPLYNVVQRLYTMVEGYPHITLRLLQSTVLLAFYEIGHGILPAGYLRIGHAARLGVMMGFHDRRHAAQLLKVSETPTLREEERRTWWAVLILDRYVHIGTSGVPLAAPDPGNGDLLPCSEVDWFVGDNGSNHPFFTSSFSVNLELGNFACLCQASHILGRVLHHRDDVNDRLDRRFRMAEAMQLERALVALDSNLSQRHSSVYISSQESAHMASFEALALCCCARLLLYNMYGCNEPDQDSIQQERLSEDTEMQQISLAGVRQIILERMLPVAQMLATRVKETGPIICYSLYHCASECAWFIKEDPNEETIGAMRTYVDLLTAIENRWKVAGLYMKLLEHEESLQVLYTTINL
ncbi:hypothetical protein K402DRAFT_391863 [Aulographum hederae CBS 113979]|uniref:Xylanolytic transcriptional activator regulatory domain-containing protein n=1 Tax=Aulographum hederae CBS 113979 TaxID=1176131 RepID=A0A6G1H6L2_9PEZI|nr:hypothetical protein K402DRAFT_391863 [Aulographum hederae CBS 113979]